MRGVYKPKASSVWWIHWYDHLGRRHREKVGTHDQARILYHKRKADSLLLAKLPELASRAAQPTVADLVADARAYIKRHHRNAAKGMGRLDRIEAELGSRVASAVRPGDLDAWIAGLNRQPATANRYKAAFSLMWRLAIQDGKAQANPARMVRRRTENNVRMRWLDAGEERKLLERVRDDYGIVKQEAATFALYSGLRLSEQARLTWQDIDWDRKMLTVRLSKPGHARSVALNSVALETLRRIRVRRRKPKGEIFDCLTAGSSPRWISLAAQSAGLEHFRWHDLRHTFASRLRLNGVALEDIKDLLGHHAIQTTFRYAHLAPSRASSAVEKMVESGNEPSGNLPAVGV
jgi:integrase